VIQYSNITY